MHADPDTLSLRTLPRLPLHHRQLYLDRNAITALPLNIFSELEALEHLTLNVNRISALPGFVFSRLRRIRILSLSDNVLTSLSAEGLFGLRELRKLHLGGNQITTVRCGWTDQLARLSTLQFDGNPSWCGSGLDHGGQRPLSELTCDCHSDTGINYDIHAAAPRSWCSEETVCMQDVMSPMMDSWTVPTSADGSAIGADDVVGSRGRDVTDRPPKSGTDTDNSIALWPGIVALATLAAVIVMTTLYVIFSRRCKRANIAEAKLLCVAVAGNPPKEGDTWTSQPDTHFPRRQRCTSERPVSMDWDDMGGVAINAESVGALSATQQRAALTRSVSGHRQCDTLVKPAPTPATYGVATPIDGSGFSPHYQFIHEIIAAAQQMTIEDGKVLAPVAAPTKGSPPERQQLRRPEEAELCSGVILPRMGHEVCHVTTKVCQALCSDGIAGIDIESAEVWGPCDSGTQSRFTWSQSQTTHARLPSICSDSHDELRFKSVKRVNPLHALSAMLVSPGDSGRGGTVLTTTELHELPPPAGSTGQDVHFSGAATATTEMSSSSSPASEGAELVLGSDLPAAAVGTTYSIRRPGVNGPVTADFAVPGLVPQLAADDNLTHVSSNSQKKNLRTLGFMPPRLMSQPGLIVLRSSLTFSEPEYEEIF